MTNDIKHVPDELGFPKGAETFPLMVVVTVTYVCNAKCPNCPYTQSTIRDTYRDTPFIPEETFKKIADECGEHGAMLRISGGGEPMLHPKAAELFVYAKQQGCGVGLITNGSSLTEEQARAMFEAGLDAIEFSSDAGDAETYARVRAGLDWDTLNRNVQMVRRLKDEMGASTRIICSVINQKGVDVEKAVAHWEQWADKVQVRKLLTWGIVEGESADETPYLPLEDRIPCPIPFDRMLIDIRGDATLCIRDIAMKDKIGNVLDGGIAQVWRGPALEELREKHLAKRGHEVPICTDCTDWQYRSWNYNYWKVLKDAEDNAK